MATPREMVAALRATIVPAALALGFDGDLPHLARRTKTGISILSLQKEKMFAAWALAKAGDEKAHAFLVTMLDDPGVQTRNRSEPGESIRAAQALADVHGWKFVWGKRSVAGIKRRAEAWVQGKKKPPRATTTSR